MVQNIHKKVEDGTPFSAVLSEYPRIFSSLYIAMVRAGEDSGQMPDVLLKISDYRVKQEEMLGRIRMAMAYPVLMALVGIGTVIFMFTMVMPRLMRIYNDMGQNLPLPTKLLLAITRGLRESWPMILIILAAAVLAGLQASRTKSGRNLISLFKLRMPVFGAFLVKAELARFARTLELLLRSGIPILRALGIAIPVVSNEIIKDRLTSSYRQLEQGGTLGRSLRETTVVPVFMSNLISVGEESGKLIDSLSELAAAYERDTDESIRILGSLLEPVMILIMGLIVGFIVMAMLLPIFQINVMVR
jgi:general secretion pathway protein F